MEKQKCKKVSFSDEKYANLYIDKLNKTSIREKKPVRSYLCEKCMLWHLTSIKDKETPEVVRLKEKIIKYKKEVTDCHDKIHSLKQKIIRINHYHTDRL